MLVLLLVGNIDVIYKEEDDYVIVSYKVVGYFYKAKLI